MNRWWVLFGTLLAIPVVACVGVLAGFTIAGNVAENEYERRAQAVTATELKVNGPNPTQITITEADLNYGFRALPKVLGMNTGYVRFTAQYDWLHARGHGFFGSHLSFVYEPVIADSGGIRLIPVKPVGVETSFDTLGYSHGGVGHAIEQGINRALTEAGVRPTAVKSRGGVLTIDLEPVG